MTDDTPIVRIRAELASDADRAAFTNETLPAIEALVSSLEIPVRLEHELATGDGRVHFGTVSPRFTATPAIGEHTLRRDDLPSYAEQFVTADVAAWLWGRWYPARGDAAADPRTMSAFLRLLREAAALGFRLTRVRDALAGVVTSPGDDWDARFEAQLSASDCACVRLYLPPGPHAAIQSGNWLGKKWSELVQFMNDGLFVELGIGFPTLTLHLDDTLAASEYRVEWNDLRLMPRTGLREHEILVNDTAERLRLMIDAAEPRENPATYQPAATASRLSTEALEASGLTTWDAPGYLILTIAAELRLHASAFVTAPWVEYALFGVEPAFPELVKATRERFTIPMLVRILRGLAREQVSLRNLATVLNGLLMVQSTLAVDPRAMMAIPLPGSGAYMTTARVPVASLSSDHYVEVARHALKREIGHKFSRGTNTLVVYLFDSAAERRLAAAPTLSDMDRRALHKAVADEMVHLPPTAQRPVLLVSSDVRPRLRDALFPEHGRLFVVSFDEIPPELNIQPVARITAEFPAA